MVFLRAWSRVQCLDEQTVESMIAMGSLARSTVSVASEKVAILKSLRAVQVVPRTDLVAISALWPSKRHKICTRTTMGACALRVLLGERGVPVPVVAV